MLSDRGDLHAAYERLRTAVGYGGRPPMNLPDAVISVYDDVGRHEEAEAVVRRWADDYPRLAYTSRAVGEVVASGGHVAAAIDTLYHHLTRFPDDLYGVSTTCSYLHSQQRFAEADSLLEHALQRWPQAADFWRIAASWAYDRGAWATAEQRYRRSIELEPYLYFGWAGLSWSIARQGRNDEAEAVFRECIARWPDDPGPVLALANFLGQAGHADEAQRTLEEAVKKWPEDTEPAKRLAYSYERAGSKDEARRQVLDNAARWPDDANMRLEASRFFVRTRQYEDAERWAREALAAAPTTEAPARLLGWTLVRQGRNEDAIPWFEQAIERQPASSSAHQGLVNALLTLERRDDALHVAEDFANRHPGSTDAWRLLARTQQASNDLFQAAVAYERVLELDKRDATAVTNLADLYRTIGQLGKAQRMVLQAAASDTTTWYVQYELAWLSLQCDDREHALEAAPRSLRAARRARDRLQSLDTMAQIQRRWGSEEKAAVAARRALVEADSCLALNHDDTDILTLDGYIQARHGDAARALEIAARLAAQERGAIVYDAACIAALVDSTDLAFEYLQKSLDRQGMSTAWVRTDPDLMSLHDDPRFEQLVDSAER
jgi:tetratricopeptide (TPR) repeat protein